jgi:hypothetical protein
MFQDSYLGVRLGNPTVVGQLVGFLASSYQTTGALVEACFYETKKLVNAFSETGTGLNLVSCGLLAQLSFHR